MRIGMILQSSFPPDIRVEKELHTLLGMHELFLLCPRRGNSPEHELWNGVKIKRIFSTAERWWSNFRLMATCYSKGWEYEIDRYIRENKLEALHVHDLPLLGTTLKAAKSYEIPVVADLHENYPAMLEELKRVSLFKTPSLGALVLRFSVSIKRWRFYEHEVVPQANAVITVIEEARDRLIQDGVGASRVHVVSNYNATTAGESFANIESGNPTQGTNSFRVVYAGGFDEARDLKTVIDSLVGIDRTEMPMLEVVLVGGAGRALAGMKKYARETGNHDRVRIYGWLSREEAEAFMDKAQVGLVPHVKSAHTDSTVPHKLFQYMVRRLPVIVSNCTPLKRIVYSAGCGLVYQSGDSQSLADCLRDIHQDPVAAKKMGEAGYAAVKEKYNWEKAGECLLGVYDELVKSPPVVLGGKNGKVLSGK